MSDVILSVKDLKTYFFLSSGTAKAVDGVTFDLRQGEILGIIGESGSGKSVMVKSTIRLLPEGIGKIVGGSVEFDEKDLTQLDKAKLRELRGGDIAMIFQDPMTSLDPVFKVGDQMVEMIRAHQNISRQEARKVAVESMRSVLISEPEARMNAYPHELSGGMCQRIIIAMALCSKSKSIIADEPTTALDVTVQAKILKLLRDLRDKNGTSILLITHNLGVIWEMCDNVIVMYAGKIVEKTDVKTLYREPLHPYTWGLLDSMPSLATQVDKRLNTIKGAPPDLRLTGRCCNFSNRCPYAQPVCFDATPPAMEVKPGHIVACHLQTGEHILRRGGETR